MAFEEDSIDQELFDLLLSEESSGNYYEVG